LRFLIRIALALLTTLAEKAFDRTAGPISFSKQHIIYNAP